MFKTVDELETHKENYVTSVIMLQMTCQTLLSTYYPMNRVKLANNCDFVVQDKNDLKEHDHEVMVIMHTMAQQVDHISEEEDENQEIFHEFVENFSKETITSYQR